MTSSSVMFLVTLGPVLLVSFRLNVASPMPLLSAEAFGAFVSAFAAGGFSCVLAAAGGLQNKKEVRLFNMLKINL